MKSVRALLVCHDEETRLAVDDVLSALGHKYDAVVSLAEAKDLLAANGYAYVLTDHEIPARPGGKPQMQNTEHLLKQAAKIKREHMPPVVIIVARMPDVDDEDKFRWAADMRTRGATTFICRPLRTRGRTLDRVIEKVLAGRTSPVRPESVPLAPVKKPEAPPSPRRIADGPPSPTSPSSSTTSWSSSASTAARRTVCTASGPCWLPPGTRP